MGPARMISSLLINRRLCHGWRLADHNHRRAQQVVQLQSFHEVRVPHHAAVGNADVIEVVEEGNRYVVSVRFTALIREEDDVPAARVEEIWHLVKPRSGDTGWLLAGIQQVQ